MFIITVYNLPLTAVNMAAQVEIRSNCKTSLQHAMEIKVPPQLSRCEQARTCIHCSVTKFVRVWVRRQTILSKMRRKPSQPARLFTRSRQEIRMNTNVIIHTI